MPNRPIRRRCFLKALGGTVLGSAVAVPQAVHAAAQRSAIMPVERDLRLVNLHTGDAIDTSFWTPQGYQHDALQSINHVLRDHRADQVTNMDIRLLEALTELSQRLGTNEPFHVISAYRSPLTNEKLRRQGRKVAKRSYHMKGQAIDIRVPGIDLKDLHRAALSLKRGGVGFYGGPGFVHIDVGPVRSWGKGA